MADARKPIRPTRKRKLSSAMTPREFDNGYWYAEALRALSRVGLSGVRFLEADFKIARKSALLAACPPSGDDASIDFSAGR